MFANINHISQFILHEFLRPQGFEYMTGTPCLLPGEEPGISWRSMSRCLHVIGKLQDFDFDFDLMKSHEISHEILQLICKLKGQTIQPISSISKLKQ